jgi:hypothetical protein
MKAHYRTKSGSLTVELEAADVKGIVKQLAAVQEVFEAETSCGCCNGTNIRFRVRSVEDNDFYELVCQDPACHAKFSFGQFKKGGGLFPKRKDTTGEYLTNRGWAK